MEIRWTEQALDDATLIRDFVARDSPAYARLTVERLFDMVSRLAQFPDHGRVVPEIGESSIRELLKTPYRIVYRRRSDAIIILTIHQFARPFPESVVAGQVSDQIALSLDHNLFSLL